VPPRRRIHRTPRTLTQLSFASQRAAHRVKQLSLIQVPTQPDQTLLVSVASDGYIRVWDLTAILADGAPRPALAAYHADVRLTCVKAYTTMDAPQGMPW